MAKFSRKKRKHLAGETVAGREGAVEGKAAVAGVVGELPSVAVREVARAVRDRMMNREGAAATAPSGAALISAHATFVASVGT